MLFEMVEKRHNERYGGDHWVIMNQQQSESPVYSEPIFQKKSLAMMISLHKSGGGDDQALMNTQS